MQTVYSEFKNGMIKKERPKKMFYCSTSYKERKTTLTQLCVNLLDKIMLKQIKARNIIRKLECPPKSPTYRQFT